MSVSLVRQYYALVEKYHPEAMLKYNINSDESIKASDSDSEPKIKEEDNDS